MGYRKSEIPDRFTHMNVMSVSRQRGTEELPSISERHSFATEVGGDLFKLIFNDLFLAIGEFFAISLTVERKTTAKTC